jgi:hypothetical protein
LGDETGKAIAHPLREFNEARVRRGLATLETAAGLLHEAGKEATPVPGRVLFPLLQSASLEDDPDLRRMWMPAYAAILSELTPYVIT